MAMEICDYKKLMEEKKEYQMFNNCTMTGIVWLEFASPKLQVAPPFQQSPFHKSKKYIVTKKFNICRHI